MKREMNQIKKMYKRSESLCSEYQISFNFITAINKQIKVRFELLFFNNSSLFCEYCKLDDKSLVSIVTFRERKQ